jgi:ubiquinone/menaquinone biosynthesis C-methylase UbiE
VIGRKYADADGYDAYMGGWSTKLAVPFLAFASVQDGGTIVDLGCGTANLLAAAATAFLSAKLIGIDPSPALLAKARGRPELSRATLLEGGVESIPLGAHTSDFTLSLLVLQEFYDRPAALAEMRRITRPGGTIAACQWDFGRMPVIDALMTAIEAVRPSAVQSIAANSPKVFVDEEELFECWRNAGLVEVRTGRITVTRTFGLFEDLWRPLRAGSTPSTLTLASMSQREQLAVRDIMEARLRQPSGETFPISAEALVITGLA